MRMRFRHRQLFSAARVAGSHRLCGSQHEVKRRRSKSGLHLEQWLAELFRDFAGGVVAARSGDAVAGVGAVAAEVEMFYGGGVGGPPEEGAHGENLVEVYFAVEGVFTGQAVRGFEVGGRERLDC